MRRRRKRRVETRGNLRKDAVVNPATGSMQKHAGKLIMRY